MTNRIQNQNTKQKETGLNEYFSIKVFNIFIIGLIVITGFLYLTQVNASAVKGYIIKDLETKLEQEKVNTQNLELEAQAKQSVSNVAEKIQALGLVNADKVEYLQVAGGTVAMK